MNDWFETEFLPDGTVKVCFQDQIGWVSSHHLAVPKALQLRTAYYRKQNTPEPKLP